MILTFDKIGAVNSTTQIELCYMNAACSDSERVATNKFLKPSNPNPTIDSIVLVFEGRRNLGSTTETTHLRHHECPRRNWSDRKEIQEQHSMEVSH